MRVCHLFHISQTYILSVPSYSTFFGLCCSHGGSMESFNVCHLRWPLFLLVADPNWCPKHGIPSTYCKLVLLLLLFRTALNLQAMWKMTFLSSESPAYQFKPYILDSLSALPNNGLAHYVTCACDHSQNWLVWPCAASLAASGQVYFTLK